MDTRSRREFMKESALAGGALALLYSGCSQQAQDPVNEVQMSIAKWQGKPEAEEDIRAAASTLTEQAVRNLGGLGRFVKKGATVWVKPNINFHRTPEFAANTNPAVVAAVVRLCYEAGAGKVRVGDHSGFGADVSYPMSGIAEAAQGAGAEVVYLDESKFKPYPLNGKVLKEWPLCPDIVEADLVVSVPVAKNHAIPTVSGCMKNFMGVAGGDRSTWHEHIADCVCDITAFMKPKVCIVDAVRVITAGPPRGGDLNDVKFMGAVAAGVDPVALDAWAAELLGHNAADVGSIAEGQTRGLGQMAYRKLNLREATVS